MIRLAFALSLGALLLGVGHSAQAQQTAQPAVSQKAAGADCKKVYVQKKSARTGKYVHVPRQRCS